MASTRITPTEAKARKDRSNHRFVWLVLIVFLSASTAGNVTSAWKEGVIGWIVAGLAPLSCFACTGLLERFYDKWAVLLGMSASAILAAYVSYVDIYHLVHVTTGNVQIAAVLPFVIDVPMLTAGYVLAVSKVNVKKKTTEPVKVPAKRTAPAKSTKTAKTAVPTQKTNTAKTLKDALDAIPSI